VVGAAALSLFQFNDRENRGFDCEMPEEAEFETFVRNYQDMVFSVSARILGNLADAEDITQEVFIKAYERFPELRNGSSIGGWLKTVSTNLSINHLNRYRARWQFFSERDKPVDIVTEPETKTDRQELLEMAIRKLPDSQRVPLVLFHFQNMSYDEIGVKLGVSLAKVKSDIHRARETLKKLLTK
jgi:RNA polymerase sigma-70 factor (ECF subfamily)